MNPKLIAFVLIVVAGNTACSPAPAPQTSTTADQRPNILLIVADDLGYSDIGAFGSEIRTPNIDSLAAHGLTLTNFHTAPTCGPTRAMLMTGIDPHPVGMAANAAAVARLEVLQGRRGYDGRLNDDAVTVATLLSDAGYQTYITGKWDLGRAPGSRAAERGFDKSFVLASAGASHFADATGSLSIQPQASYLEGTETVLSLPDDFYSSRFYTEKMQEYMASGDDDLPFFAYAAYTAPHWPLQVPDDWLDRYAGRYDDGWTALAASRRQRQQALGLFEALPPLVAARGVADWQSLGEAERRRQAKVMEIYAAMIEYMDWQIGSLIEAFEAASGDRPTMIIFLSDNGPEGNAVDRIGRNAEWIAANFDNSIDNMGRVGSFLWQGPGWAQASAQPLKLYKSFVTEGGTRTPAIISKPGMQNEGARSDVVLIASDVPATILAAAGVSHPGARYKGRDILPIEGRSMLPLLDDPSRRIHADESLGFELYGNRALIRNDWKATLIWPPAGNGEWQLFNIARDPFEANDVGEEYPDVLDELAGEWDRYADRHGIYRFELDNGYGRY